MSKKVNVKKLANLDKAAKAIPPNPSKATRTPPGDKRVHSNERLLKKVKGTRDAPSTSSNKKSGIPLPITAIAEG